MHDRSPEEILLGSSAAMCRVREQLVSAASTEVPVLLTGESGTGKDLAAKMLHDLGPRKLKNYVKVNCPAIPGQLFESELFGHEAGAFTGAKKAKPGKFEQANHGTIFLDEIGELEIGLQSKLLRALQDFQIVRVNVRLICGTNRKLDAEIAKGNFRADLFYRINVLNIQMPPLRERRGDVATLMNHFVQIYSDQYGKRPQPLSSSVMRLLEGYHWPGNLRELENLAKRHVVLGGEDNIVASLRQPGEQDSMLLDSIDLNMPLRIQTKRAVRHLEHRIILGVLQAHKWNRRKAARSLDISYRALLYKIKEAGLPSIRSVKSAEITKRVEEHEGAHS
jgi:two-component system response regulator AtoC